MFEKDFTAKLTYHTRDIGSCTFNLLPEANLILSLAQSTILVPLYALLSFVFLEYKIDHLCTINLCTQKKDDL